MTQTDQLLMDAFRQLLEEKPYKKITVRDIVDRCQVNRNTFYYHFEGIPALLEQVMKTWADDILADPRISESPLLALLPMAEFCSSHRSALLHLVQSKAKEEVLSFIDLICLHVAEQHVKKAAQTAALSHPFTDLESSAMIRFYKAVLSGYLRDWINEDMGCDLCADIPRVILRLKEFAFQPSQQELTPIPKASGPV